MSLTWNRTARKTKSLLNQPLESADREHPGPLVITSLAIINDKLYLGSLSRGVLAIEDGLAREVETRPAVYFVRALDADSNGKVWLGARVKKDEPGLFSGGFSKLGRNETQTGTVTDVRAIGQDVWSATDGHGVLLVSGAKKVQRFIFECTDGGLRSDHVYAIFQIAKKLSTSEPTAGFAVTIRNAPRVEQIGE